jgi:hypothetical protein
VRLRHALEIAKRLEELDVEAQVRAQAAQLRG